MWADGMGWNGMECDERDVPAGIQEGTWANPTLGPALAREGECGRAM